MSMLLDHAECVRCDGTVVEPLDDEGTAACCYCGLRVRVCRARAAEIERTRKPGGEEFRLQYGRFAGLTFAEVVAQPNGLRYLEALAAGNDKLRARVEGFLASEKFSLDEWTEPRQIV